MKMSSRYLFIALFLCFPVLSWNQGVLISPLPGNPDPSAILHAQDTSKGFLMPSMTTAQRNAIANPAIGLQIINITTECMEVYFSDGWKQIVCNCSGAPGQPGLISGPVSFCANQTGGVYSISPVPGAVSYTWTVPPGVSILSGQGTASITVDYTNTGGAVSVTATNSCGTSLPSNLAISLSVPDANFSWGSAVVNLPVGFTALPGYSSYAWSFQGASPANSTAQNPSATWGVIGTYPVSLIVTNSIGCSDTVTQNVTVINCPPFSMTFTNCGAVGRSGPNQTQANNTYGPGVVTITGSGIQQWVVPATGNYSIEAAGAKGYGVYGGRGAIISGEINLTAGTVLQILVGQNGPMYNQASYDHQYSGGGGTFVTDNSNTPYIVAGGGGGNHSTSAFSSTCDGQMGPNGGAGTNGSGLGAGGTNGSGGGTSGSADGGGGFTGNGSGTAGGFSFTNGGLGATYTYTDGGFGGGGATSSYNNYRAAGGGGYSGGGGATNGGSCCPTGGGGGSFVHAGALNVKTSTGTYNGNSMYNGSPIVNLGTYNANNGYVIITRVCP